MIHVAELCADLCHLETYTRFISILGRTLVVHGRNESLTTTACRSMSIWPAPDSGTSQPDDTCIVEVYSAAHIQPGDFGQPIRSYYHPHMGIFQVHEMADGSAVVQSGRGAILCSNTGELVWLIEDGLLKNDSDRWPNLTDLAIVVTAEILRRSGNYLTHAGAVGREGHCILLAGESGSGKTTFTVRKVMEGWDFYGDDMVIVGRDGNGMWQVHPFWRPVHLTSSTLALLGGLNVPAELYTVSNKLRCDITEMADVRRPPPASIDKVFCLQAGWQPQSPTLLSKTAALAALGSTFLSGFIPQNAESDLDNLLDFLSDHPVYEASWATQGERLELIG
jgi:hypothetical protein